MLRESFKLRDTRGSSYHNESTQRADACDVTDTCELPPNGPSADVYVGNNNPSLAYGVAVLPMR